MTDKEPLELAAKAAGLSDYEYMDNGYGYECMAFDPGGSKSDYWNPLIDDGDALRLAVKLRMEILVEEIRISVYSELTVEKCEMYPADHLATTRRLIVETAAEIGKAMP